MVVNENGTYKSKAYIEAFKQEVTNVIDKLEHFVDSLMELEDEVYNQKDAQGFIRLNALRFIIEGHTRR